MDLIRYKNLCFGCLKSINSETNHYCSACRKSIFGNSRLQHCLEFDKQVLSGETEQAPLALHRGRLLYQRTGDYLLETVPEITGIRYVEDIPANKHLMACIAKQIFGLETESPAIVFFPDGEQALVRPRFQISGSRRPQRKNFLELLKPGQEGDYQSMAKSIIQRLPARTVELENFYAQVLFHYMIGNTKADARAFSIHKRPSGDFGLSPLNTLYAGAIHHHQGTPIALPLFEGGYMREGSRGADTLAREDFILFARFIGVNEANANELIEGYGKEIHRVFDLTERSLMSDAAKKLFKKHYFDRVKSLK